MRPCVRLVRPCMRLVPLSGGRPRWVIRRSCAAAAFIDLWISGGLGWRRKPGPACGSMTATPASVVYLVEGVIFAPLLPPLRCAFRVKALTFFGRTTAAPVASLPPWRRRWKLYCWWLSVLFGECPHLRLASLTLSTSPGCFGHRLADALPSCSGRCFAALSLWFRADTLPLC